MIPDKAPEPTEIGYALMREHEIACEAAAIADAPELVSVLRDASDCIVRSVHALDGLDELEPAQQAVFTQLALGARTSRIFVGLALTGHYESAMAVARVLIEDGIACAYLAGNPTQAARWIEGTIAPKYGAMASAVISASAENDAPSEGEAWQRAGEALWEMRRILDDLSHANPARFKFIRQREGYILYPFFDRDALELVTYFAMHSLAQLTSFSRKWLAEFGREPPSCNSADLHSRMESVLDQITSKAERTEETRKSPSDRKE